jgi:Flp pilus assembly protein TadD/TolB-like protein
MSIARRYAVAVGLLMALPSATSAQPAGPVTLVVPFALEKFEPRVGWLGEGVAIGVTAALEERGIDVVSRDERLGVFERLQLPPGVPLTRATIIKVAELVGAARVVLGRVSASGTDVTIDAQVLQVDSARLDPPSHHLTPVSGLLNAFRAVASFAVPGGAPAAGQPALAPSVQAVELYVRGLTTGNEEVQERYLSQALEAAPDYAEARLALWDVQSSRGAHELALATLKGVPSGGPHALDVDVRRAASLAQLRRYDEAFAALKAPAGEVRSPVAANLLGVIQLRRGGTSTDGRPTYFFHQAAEADPADPDYCFNLGYAYWLDKDPLAAAYWLREAVRRDPTDGDAHFVLAAALASSGAGPEAERERELARRLSERWQAATAGDSVPRGLERVKDRVSGARTRVNTVLQAGAQRDQREAAAFHLEAARRAFAAGRDPETVRETRRALYLTPYESSAHLLLGRALARSGLLEEAVDALKIAIWSAETAAAHVALGEVLLRLRNVDGASRAADRALALEPANADAAALATRVRATRPGGAA